MVSPQAKREAVTLLLAERDFGVTRACGLVGISRSLYRYRSRRPDSTACGRASRRLPRRAGTAIAACICGCGAKAGRQPQALYRITATPDWRYGGASEADRPGRAAVACRRRRT